MTQKRVFNGAGYSTKMSKLQNCKLSKGTDNTYELNKGWKLVR